ASGPANPPTVSGTTSSPKAANRSGSPLALMTMAPTCGRSRSITCASIGLPARSRRHLSPPPMRRDRPPASKTPVTSSTGSPLIPSILGGGEAALAGVPAVLVPDPRDIRIVDDALDAGQGHKPLAACAADKRQARPARKVDSPGREARSGHQDGDAHLDRLDDRFGCQTAGRVEGFVVRLDLVEEH